MYAKGLLNEVNEQPLVSVILKNTMETTKEEPLVSVIVTTYNRKELLKETIDSILNQTFRDFELIVVDNFSDYDFFSYIESFNDKRITPFQNRNNGIIAVNRNFGIRKAKGEYIAFCDDDDLWFPNKLEVQLKHFDDDIIGVGSGLIAIGDLRNKRHKVIKKDMLLDFNKIISVRAVGLSSLMVKNLGYLFDESEQFEFVEDFDYQLKIAQKTKGKILLLSLPLIYYRYHKLNNSNINSATNVFNVINKYKNDLSKKVLKESYQRFYYSLGWMMLKTQHDDAKHFLVKATRYSNYNNVIRNSLLLALSVMPKFFQKEVFNRYFQLRLMIDNIHRR